MNSVRIERQSSELPVTALFACALAAVAVAWLVFGYGYIEDDAYIHLEFARSVADGKGFAFNGHVVYGDTAPLWVLILVGIHSLGLGWIVSAKVACTAGLIVAVSGAWTLGRGLAGGNVALQSFPAVAVLVTVVNPYFAHWSFAGMESVAALGLSFWAISLGLLGRPTLRRCLLAAALLGVGPLLRPEFVLLDAIVGSLLLLRCWRGSESLGSRLGTVAVLAILMVLPVAIWSGYALDTFGAVVPNTNKAKQGGPLREIAPRLLSVYALGFPVTLALVPFVLPRLVRRRIPVAVAVLLLWPLACIAFYLADHTVVQTRYSLLSMPSLSIAVLWLVADGYSARRFAAAAASMVLAAAALIALIVVPHVTNKEKYSSVLAQASEFLRNQVPSRAPVAVFAIGQIAFESDHPIVDIGGITDQSVIPHMASTPETVEWAKAHGARYYITAEPPEPGSVRVFAASVPYLGWTLNHSLYGTQQAFAIYRLP